MIPSMRYIKQYKRKFVILLLTFACLFKYYFTEIDMKIQDRRNEKTDKGGFCLFWHQFTENNKTLSEFHSESVLLL